MLNHLRSCGDKIFLAFPDTNKAITTITCLSPKSMQHPLWIHPGFSCRNEPFLATLLTKHADVIEEFG